MAPTRGGADFTRVPDGGATGQATGGESVRLTESVELATLGDAARSVWAKSPEPGGRWLPLWQHMDDAAAIAGVLFDDWLPSRVSALLAADFGHDLIDARTATRLFAGAHDIGKATPAFAVKNVLLAQRMSSHGLYVPPHVVDYQLGHHTLTGHHLLSRWLVSAHGFKKSDARTWGVVVGGHHGAPPDSVSECVTPTTHPDLFGEGTWTQVQVELLRWIARLTGADDRLACWSGTRLSQRVQVLMTAIVIVSDWIASNEELCPYLAGDLPPVTPSSDRVGHALRMLGLPPRWHPPADVPDARELVARRFELPAGATARPVQVEAIELARSMTEPGLMIIEAPMGEGKTEAAFAVAEVLARRWGCGGVFIGLPTQATADAMFARVVAWLDRMSGTADQQVASTMTLSHGKARLNREFEGLLREGFAQESRLREIGQDEPGSSRRSKHAVTAHAWLSGRKKAQLADFVVGTIDQLLFAGLRSRHLMLRHLGLAGKVVIIDEVHAYDVYMSTYLDRVLNWLGTYGVPVAVLSATLPSGRRRALVDAYRCGVADRTGESGSTAAEASVVAAYPLITSVDDHDERQVAVPSSGRSARVELHLLADDDDALVDLLTDLLSDGGTALVVRNVVRRALATADRLRARFGDQVTVAHARFLAADRVARDEWLLDNFGPPDRLTARGTNRPGRHITVATQVVEQSLDIDFDVLVTDLAPVDLVLQRMGRLHRHKRGPDESDRPRKLRQARCYLTAVDVSTDPPEPESGSVRVYGRHALYRSMVALWPKIGGAIELPSDISPLVELAYGDYVDPPPGWADALESAHASWVERSLRRAASAQVFQVPAPAGDAPIIGWVSASVGEADDDAQGVGQVRDGAPSLEVLVVEQDEHGTWWTPSWVVERGGIEVPQEVTPPLDVARAMSACSLRLPIEFSNEAAERDLWERTPEPWEDSPAIYRLPVLVISPSGDGEIAGSAIRYTRERGLEVLRHDD